MRYSNLSVEQWFKGRVFQLAASRVLGPPRRDKGQEAATMITNINMIGDYPEPIPTVDG